MSTHGGDDVHLAVHQVLQTLETDRAAEDRRGPGCLGAGGYGESWRTGRRGEIEYEGGRVLGGVQSSFFSCSQLSYLTVKLLLLGNVIYCDHLWTPASIPSDSPEPIPSLPDSLSGQPWRNTSRNGGASWCSE